MALDPTTPDMILQGLINEALYGFIEPSPESDEALRILAELSQKTVEQTQEVLRSAVATNELARDPALLETIAAIQAAEENTDTPQDTVEEHEPDFVRTWALSEFEDVIANSNDAALLANEDLIAAAIADYEVIHGTNSFNRDTAVEQQELLADANSFWNFRNKDAEIAAAENFDPETYLVEWIREDFADDRERIEFQDQALLDYPI